MNSNGSIELDNIEDNGLKLNQTNGKTAEEGTAESKTDSSEHLTQRKTRRSVRNLIKAVSVRICLFLHSSLTIWRAADIVDDDKFWLLALGNILLIAEGLYRIIKRNGEESKWATPCYFIYLGTTLPAIWLMELDRLDRYDITVANTNLTTIREEALSTIHGVTLPVRFDPDTWLSILEQSMIFILIIGRWILPRGKLTRDQLSQLLFVYLGIASDIMELFIIFEEPILRRDRTLALGTLGVWSLSFLQFCVALTATQMKAHRSRAVGVVELQTQTIPKEKNDKKMQNFFGKYFQTELWSLHLSAVLMDIPFLCIRLYALFGFNVLSYGILFFVCKNILMIFLLMYRLVVICFFADESEYVVQYDTSFEKNSQFDTINNNETEEEDQI